MSAPTGVTVTAAPATRTPNAPSTNQIKKGLHPEMTDQPTDIETAAANHPDVIAGIDDANNGRTKKRGRPAGVANQAAEKGARFAPKLDADAREALRKLAVLNSVGLAPTVDEITIGATDHASQQASRWVVAQYEKATASMKKIEP